MHFKSKVSIAAGLILFFLAACGPKTLVPKAALDTPTHHVSNGNKLLQSGKMDDALYEFNRARELDPACAPAYLGIGLVYGLKGDFENGFHALNLSNNYARTEDEKKAVIAGTMRLLIEANGAVGRDWLERVEEQFNKATAMDPGFPDAHYYMGLAYKVSNQFEKAASQFLRVLEINDGFVEEAGRDYTTVRQIVRAMPVSEAGKAIALLKRISRADMAVLLIEELRVEDLFPTVVEKSRAFETEAEALSAVDIHDHAFRTVMEKVIALNVKGIDLFGDGMFQPDRPVTRAEFAMVIEDILVRTSRNDHLAKQFIGRSSPFSDLRSDTPYFTAVMVVTTRGIMEVKNIRTGQFDPMGEISGAEALLSLYALKRQLQK